MDNILFKNDDLEIIPIQKSETIPSEWYTNPELFNIDNKEIFSKTWQYVGHISDLQKEGDVLVTEVAGNPIIVLKDKNSDLQAFYNVCRHRAGPIALKSGNYKILQCRYHGWRYNFDGSLCGTTEFKGVEDFDFKNYSLFKVKVDIWENMIFVNLSENPISLNSIFEGIIQRISPINLNSKKFYKRITYDLNCNWKVYVDNFLEGYHLPYVHPSLTKLLNYNEYITEVYNYYSLQHSPFKDTENVYGKEEDGEAFYYFVYPNFMMNILPNRLQINNIIPVSYNKTKVVFDYYFDDIESKESLEIIDRDLEYSDEVQYEDIDICEHVQKGLESKHYNKGRYSVEQEKGLYHFHNLLRKSYKGS